VARDGTGRGGRELLPRGRSLDERSGSSDPGTGVSESWPSRTVGPGGCRARLGRSSPGTHLDARYPEQAGHPVRIGEPSAGASECPSQEEVRAATLILGYWLLITGDERLIPRPWSGEQAPRPRPLQPTQRQRQSHE